MILKDKVVFITGGAQGLGKGVANAVLNKGGKVCLADINNKLGKATETEFKSSYGRDKAMFVKCDVTNQGNLEEAFKRAVSKFGNVDIMCNNAGIMDESVWEKQVAINFNAVVYGTNIAMEHMRTDKGGKGGVIINTASNAALMPCFWFPVYSATKSAVYNFTYSWAENPELKAAGVRFTSMCPSGVRTALMDMKEHQIIDQKGFKEIMEEYGYCKLEDVAAGFIKAMEDDTISGNCINVKAMDGITHVTLQPVRIDEDPSTAGQ